MIACTRPAVRVAATLFFATVLPIAFAGVSGSRSGPSAPRENPASLRAGVKAEPVNPQQPAPGSPSAQTSPAAQAPSPGRADGARQRPEIPMDPDRARQLYVSNRPEDHAPGYDFKRDMDTKAAIDKRYADASRGLMDFRKVTYRSGVGDLDIPAYLFQPLRKRGTRGHAAMVWVHGGVHGNWGISMFPFVKDAVDRGYVVICPEYRGSTGFGERHHNAIDYGGYEIDDVMSAVDFLKTLPHVDQARLGILGWSHGGYITLFTVFREQTPFKAAAAMVPVTNLVFRLSYKGPGYQRGFSTQSRVQGLPFEKRDLYIERSPLYHVDKLKTPLLVHVATNDTDVNFVEDQQIIDALRSRKPDLAETRIYVDPPPGPASGGHTFNRRTNTETLERNDSPEQRDSWNRTWTFFEWHLRPYEDRSHGSRF
jgi:dienelactone hydrolase